ncbi:MAG TPA: GYD domain-containing protein [Gemmataceae bacterium]
MATYVTTIQFTGDGIRNIRDTCDRAAAFKAAVRKMGVKVTGQFWTTGPFDGLIVLDAPDEATATAALLHLGMQGEVRTQTARAFTAAEMAEILAKLPG